MSNVVGCERSLRTDNARGHDSEAHKDYAARSRVGELFRKDV